MLHNFVIQSVAKDLGNILYGIEILPPYGRLNDKMMGIFKFDTLFFCFSKRLGTD